MKRITSVEDHRLSAAYASVRETLTSAKYADRMDKPLAFWALPGDRRLPMALLGHPLKKLLSQPLDKLAETPGIGNKKLSSLLKLLHRATKSHPPSAPSFHDESKKAKGTRGNKRGGDGFDPAIVSELLWEEWRQTVKRYGLRQETLGRLAPSLERLPTVIWRTPLSEYLDLTVGEIRRRKTHGEKRVRAILEVFYSVHETLGQVPHHGHLRVDLRPKFTVPIEQWINDAMRRSQPPSVAEIKAHVVLPILEQLKIDAGPAIFRLLEERLGTKSAPQPVQQQAKRLGVTRARVYQLFEMCGDIMSVRWPEGEKLFERFHQKLASFPNAKAQVIQLRALAELIYPELEYTAGGAAKPKNQANAKGNNRARTDRSPSRRDVANHHHLRGKTNGAPRTPGRAAAVARG